MKKLKTREKSDSNYLIEKTGLFLIIYYLKNNKKELQEFQQQYNIKFKLKIFSTSKESAINMLIYGEKFEVYNRKKKKFSQCFAYILEDDPSYLQILKIGKNKEKITYDLMNLINITNKINFYAPLKFKTDRILILTFNSTFEKKKIKKKVSELILIFESEEKREIFWQGVQFFFLIDIKY